MANNIPPELLMQLLGQQYRAPSSGSGWSPETAYGPTYDNQNFTAENGDTWHTNYMNVGNDTSSLENGAPAWQVRDYGRDHIPGRNKPGDIQDSYDSYGKYMATGAIPKDTTFQDFLIMAAMVAGPFAAAMGGVAGAGAGGLMVGDATMPGLLGAGGSEVAYGSLIPGLESYALPAAAGGAAGGAAGASAGANPGYSFLGGDATMPGALGANGANMSTAALPGLESYVTGTTGSLLSGGAKSLLGPAATLLGGAAGAAGGDDERSTTKDVPEWLKPYVTKNLEYAGGLLDKQMQPGAMAGYDQMRNVGQGLLNQPMAGNGFSKFFPGR